MNKNYLLSFFFIFVSTSLLSQPSAVTVFDSINHKLSEIKQGYFDSSFGYKSASKEDTTRWSGRIYFFKNLNSLDTFRLFVVFLEGKLWRAYDGDFFFQIDGKNNKITTSPASNGSVKSLFRGTLDMLAFKNFLYDNKNAFSLEKYNNTSIETEISEQFSGLKTTTVDSFKNEFRISEKDPEMGYTKVEYKISLPDYSILQRLEWVHFLQSPQYLENKFSPIYPLPDSVKFNHLFNLDSLLAHGYILEDYNAKQTPTPLPLITEGKHLPEFFLPNLNSEIVNSTQFKDGIILLDFWYRSCYPCLKALPGIERLHQKYEDKGLTVLGINSTDKDPIKLKKFLVEREITYTTLLDSDKEFVKKLNVAGFPTMLIVDAATKKVLYVHEGYGDETEQKLNDKVESFLKKD